MMDMTPDEVREAILHIQKKDRHTHSDRSRLAELKAKLRGDKPVSKPKSERVVYRPTAVINGKKVEFDSIRDMIRTGLKPDCDLTDIPW